MFFWFIAGGDMQADRLAECLADGWKLASDQTDEDGANGHSPHVSFGVFLVFVFSHCLDQGACTKPKDGKGDMIYKDLTWFLAAMSWELCNFASYLILGMVYTYGVTDSWNGVYVWRY